MDWDRFKKVGLSQLDKPYIFGIEVDLKDPSPKAFDCSELVEWLFAQCGYKVPDGSQNQFEASLPCTRPRLGDVGFFRHPGAPTHHVGIYFTDGNVLEARGDPFNKVILRPVAKWEAWKEFTGWRRFNVIED